jgi:hypothetical protein
MIEEEKFPRGSAEAEEEEIARVLGQSGRRPALQPMDRARIKAASRAAWQVKVHGERHRRLARRGALAAAGGVLVVLAILFFPHFAPEEPPLPVATIERAEGEIRVDGRPAAPADLLAAGAGIDTSAAARVALQLAGGGSLRLDRDSRVRLVAPGSVELVRGRLYFDSQGRTPSAPLTIETAHGQVRDIGTCFELAVATGEALLEVRVREGSVLLSGRGAAQTTAAGFELRLLADGRLEQRATPLSGPRWDWVAQIAPPFAIEGRTLREFLDHLARESGWVLQFAEPGLAAKAQRTILHGSSEGLGREAALASLLAGSELGYRLEGDLLVIQKAR